MLAEEIGNISRKFREAAILARQLEDSVALEQAIPGIFKYGSVKTVIFSYGSRSRPMFRIVYENGTQSERPLVDMPPAVIAMHRELVESITRRPPCHVEWRKALKIIKEYDDGQDNGEDTV